METTTRTYVSDLVEQVGSLPSVAAQVVSLASDPDCEIDHLTKAIMSDSAMSLRFLALANSAAVSHGREIRNLRAALVRLGMRRVRNVALLMGMHDMSPSRATDTGLDTAEFWRHSLATASCAQALAWLRGMKTTDDAWLVGILHGLGIAAMSQKAAEQFRAALELARRQGKPLAAAELEVFDFHHGELAGRVLRTWKLPRVFAEVVEFNPEDFEQDEVSSEALPLIAILRDAIVTARSIGFGQNGDGDRPVPAEELADRLGLPEPAMAALAERVDQDVQGTSRVIGLDMPEGRFAEALAASRDELARVGLAGLDATLAREEMEEQMAAARDIQQRLLPDKVPDVAGCELAAVNEPSLHVSGDTYDFLRLPDGRTAIVVADVSGKGMPAALLASTLQASLRALVRVFSDPGELLAAVNDALFESTDPERFATVFLAVLAADGSGFSYASAGHNPPLLLRADGRAEWLKPAGTPVGMLPGMAYPVQDVLLHAGDRVVIYTDGVTEALDATENEFAETGLESVVREGSCAAPAAGTVEAVIAAVRDHVAGSTDPDAGQDLLGAPGPRGAVDVGDDLTLVVVRRLDA
jgi:serine phosphatase RsbU (regulator of sigma subunit)/HD-like signal output (HDOD) protein